jgi:hypothetical protein
MNKFHYALALGAGLLLSLTTPNAHASAMVQSLDTANMSATQFDSLFTPIQGAPEVTGSYAFLNTTGTAGTVSSQVFEGTGKAAGLYAYAYQFTVSNAKDTTTGASTSVNSASMLFNATPVVTNFTGTSAAAYTISSGAVGSLGAPLAAGGNGVQTPSSIVWQPGSTTGSLTYQYLNATTGAGPLAAGATSGTIVVLSTQPYSKQNVYVSLQNPEPQNSYPTAYSPTTGSIDQVPAPEPATVLAWTSVLAALAVGHRFRRNHKPLVA